ncbi:MAG TPA: serine/threonine-protein kinase [Kofleriaceae bacterium]|nr:serine/threonine-protein kinase [Kofleriaceae bacterium]
MKVCTGCATKTDETGRFCPECGAPLVEAGRSVIGRATTQPSDPNATDVLPQSKKPESSSASKLIGLTIDGQFEIDGILGGGAFGTVYRGRQNGLDRPVAIKVPTSEIAADPVMARRFAREARSAARIQHPGVVAIYAVGELADGRPYLAMQYVEGEPLDKVLADGPLSPVRALRIARQIASALSETHVADVVHRDLKPTNIMWRRDRNGDDRITIVDFGIAVCKPGNADATRLTAGGLIGTPHYMSPEQAHGEQVDARADLYALGCLLFELVTGAPPFEGSGFEVLLAHLGRPAPLPSEKNPNVPEAVDRICAMLMRKKPDDRPQHADEVVALIDEALAELAGKEPATAPAPMKKRKSKKRPTIATLRDLPEGTELPHQRRSRRMLLAALAVIMLVGGAGFAVYQMREKPALAIEPDPDDAPADSDPRVGRRRTLTKDNGEMIVTAMVPDPLVAGQEIRSRLEIKNKLGQPVVADEIVLTIGDSTGAAKGLTARPRRTTGANASATAGAPGRYYFRYTFPAKGHYTLRVFPPSIDSSFEIPVDVE